MTDDPQLIVGNVQAFTRMKPEQVMGLLTQHYRDKGVDAQFSYWTDPPNASPTDRCATIYVFRSDGLSESDIEAVKRGAAVPSKRAAFAHRFVFDPVAWNQTFPPDYRIKRPAGGVLPRRSKLGWEYMELGDSITARIHTQDAVRLLAKAILQRELDWQFEFVRLPHMELAGDKITVWRITRIK